MAEVEGVAQFMDGLLGHATTKGLQVWSPSLRKTVGGEDARFSSQLRFSVDMGQYRNEKVDSLTQMLKESVQ